MKAERIYYLYSGFVYFFFNMVFAISGVYYVQRVGLNPLELVLIGTVVETSALIFEIPTGVFADSAGRKKSIILGLLIVGLSFVIEGAIPLFWAIILSQIVAGAGYTFLSGADIAWVADESESKNLNGILIRGAQFEQLGSLIGIWFGVLLAMVALNLPIVLSGISLILFAIILRLVMKERNFRPLGSEKSLAVFFTTFRDGVRQFRRSRTLAVLLVVGFLIGLYSEGFDRLWILKFLEDLRIPQQLGSKYLIVFGVVSSGAMVLSMITLALSKRATADASSKLLLKYLIGINLVLGFAFIGFSLSGRLEMALAFYWAGFAARRNDYPLYAALINKQISVSSVRATVISVARQFDSFGQIAGGPLIGLVALRLSSTVALAITGLLVFPIVVLYFLLLYRKHHEDIE